MWAGAALPCLAACESVVGWQQLPHPLDALNMSIELIHIAH